MLSLPDGAPLTVTAKVNVSLVFTPGTNPFNVVGSYLIPRMYSPIGTPVMVTSPVALIDTEPTFRLLQLRAS